MGRGGCMVAVGSGRGKVSGWEEKKEKDSRAGGRLRTGSVTRSTEEAHQYRP